MGKNKIPVWQKFIIFLLRTGMLSPNSHLIKKWRERKRIEVLLFLLAEGRNTIRKSAAYALGEMGEKRAVPLLIKNIQSPFVGVAEECINSVIKLGVEDDYREILEKEKERVHQIREKNSKNRGKNKTGRLLPDKKEKMKRLEQLKEQLKKPMRWGQ